MADNSPSADNQERVRQLDLERASVALITLRLRIEAGSASD